MVNKVLQLAKSVITGAGGNNRNSVITVISVISIQTQWACGFMSKFTPGNQLFGFRLLRFVHFDTPRLIRFGQGTKIKLWALRQ
jgi:hypothetical protein